MDSLYPFLLMCNDNIRNPPHLSMISDCRNVHRPLCLQQKQQVRTLKTLWCLTCLSTVFYLEKATNRSATKRLRAIYVRTSMLLQAGTSRWAQLFVQEKATFVIMYRYLPGFIWASHICSLPKRSSYSIRNILSRWIVLNGLVHAIDDSLPLSFLHLFPLMLPKMCKL